MALLLALVDGPARVAASSPASACTGRTPSSPATSRWPWRSAPPAPARSAPLVDRLGMRYAPAVLRLMGPKHGRQVPPQDRPGGQPGRPDHRPLRGPPRGLRLPRRRRRRWSSCCRAARRWPSLLFAFGAVLDRGRHLGGDPHPQGRHRADAARLPRRPRRRGQRGARLPPGPGPRRVEVRGPLGGRDPHHPAPDGPRRQPPPGLRPSCAAATTPNRSASSSRRSSRARNSARRSSTRSSRSPRTCAARTPRTPAARRPARSPGHHDDHDLHGPGPTMILLGAGVLLGSGTDFELAHGRTTRRRACGDRAMAAMQQRAHGMTVTATDVRHRPWTRRPPPIQVNALQAMCRQVFGFRLAMIAVAAPPALLNAAPGIGVRLVGAAVVVTFMGSYVLFRDWERFGPLLLRHPSLLAVDTLFGALLLVSAGPDTTLAYVSVCTPLLAGTRVRLAGRRLLRLAAVADPAAGLRGPARGPGHRRRGPAAAARPVRHHRRDGLHPAQAHAAASARRRRR